MDIKQCETECTKSDGRILLNSVWKTWVREQTSCLEEFYSLRDRLSILQSDTLYSPICIICHSPVHYDLSKKDFMKCCSRDCAGTLNSLRMKGVKFSDEHKARISVSLKKANAETDVGERRKATCNELYGGNAPASSKDVQAKMRSTMVERHGVEFAAQSPELLGKMQTTCLERFGSTTNLNTPEHRELTRQFMLDNYGVEHALQSPEIRDRYRATCQERFGVDNPQQNEDVRRKTVQTCLSKFGTPNPNQKHLAPIYQNLIDAEWWSRFKNMDEIYLELDDWLTASAVIHYTHRFRPELVGTGCLISRPHRMINEFLDEIGVVYQSNVKKIIGRLELDVWIPTHSLAIEVNGLWSHSELHGKDRACHLRKTRLCEEQGIRLLQFWDTEIQNQRPIVNSIILNALGLTTKNIYARECEIREISSQESREFYDANHLQGSISCKHNIGLLYQGELVSAMSFSKSRFRSDASEIVRFASAIGVRVIGGASRLWSRRPAGDIVSYSDNRYTQGGVYQILGFQPQKESPPSYYYTRDYSTLSNRMKFQKHKLRDLLEHFDPELTEWQNMTANGWDRVWDCGTRVWLYSHYA